MKIKTSVLTGPALDWAVAKCEGWKISLVEFRKSQLSSCKFSYSSRWGKGGPIIERERISVISDFHDFVEGWLAENYQDNIQQFGPTPLIAAMRCYCFSKLGDVVDIPEELFK